MIEKALSVRSPWWWFILHAGKDIENRDWPTKFRGTVYLHASKWWRHEDGLDDIRSALDCCADRAEVVSRFSLDKMHASKGCIVGQVDIVDCVSRSASPWFFGEYGFVLENAVAYDEPLPCKGALGFFAPDFVGSGSPSFGLFGGCQ